MTPTPQPPHRAVRLLERTLPRDAREHVIGDLHEMFVRQCSALGEPGARRWYWRQAAAFALRFSWERRRDRAVPGPAPSPDAPRAHSRPSLIDVKLGVRMLVKHPALTLIGGFAIMVAIGIGAAWFEFSNDYMAPRLPLDEGDRIIGVRNWDASELGPESQVLHDYIVWRDEARTLQDLGAYRTLERNLITDDGRAEPVSVAELTASAFRVARVQPLLGRGILEDDERAGATPVVVLGHGVWQTRFGGERDVLGRTVRVGNVTAEIVGVMPEGFAFPVNHRLWMPLRLDPTAYERRAGPSLLVVGRLAPGVTREEAQTELAMLGARMAAEFPQTHRHLRPQVLPFVESLSDDIGRTELLAANAIFIMILIVACTNVATLVFARAATREREIAVRTALGASRGRIIMQLFIEALVLASVAAVIGLALVAVGLKVGMRVFWEVQGGAHVTPFWWNDDLAPATVLYVGLLTVIGAAITGILPALKVTGRDVASRLRQATAGGAAIRFGGIWTAIIVVQVGITVAFLSAASTESRQNLRTLMADVQVRAERYLAVQLLMDRDVPPAAEAERYEADFAARLARRQNELRERLLAEPGVTAVTFASQLPGVPHWGEYIELDGGAAVAMPERGHRVRTATVDVGFFDTFDAPILSGRDFQPSDVESDRRVVIVNESFVADLLGGRNPVGLRIRRPAQPGGEEQPWYEIIGVVKDLGMSPNEPRRSAGVYRPMKPGSVHPTRLAVQVAREPAALAPRLREIVAEVDPTLRLYEMRPLAELARAERESAFIFLLLHGALVMVAFLLSTAGVYSLMSLTVSQRTREIGIRAALGADPRQILMSIFGRSLAQLALGVGLGAAVVLLTGLSSPGEGGMAESVWTAVGVSLLMVLVGLTACVVPARRGLRIQPTEALRAGE